LIGLVRLEVFFGDEPVLMYVSWGMFQDLGERRLWFSLLFLLLFGILLFIPLIINVSQIPLIRLQILLRDDSTIVNVPRLVLQDLCKRSTIRPVPLYLLPFLRLNGFLLVRDRWPFRRLGG
jgi:hypothetical protein